MTTSLPHAKSMVEHEDLIYASTTTRMHANFDKEKAKTIASRTDSKLKCWSLWRVEDSACKRLTSVN